MKKELVFEEFTKMIKESWTYARMTKEEQNRIIYELNNTETKKTIKGTYKQRWNILHLMYESFLEGLGYKPIGWRELK